MSKTCTITCLRIPLCMDNFYFWKNLTAGDPDIDNFNEDAFENQELIFRDFKASDQSPAADKDNKT